MSVELIEEIEVLSSIYNEAIAYEESEDGVYIVKYMHLTPKLVGTFVVPPTYPLLSAAQFSVSIADTKLSNKLKPMLEIAVRKCVSECIGEVVLFNAIQVLVDTIDNSGIVNSAPLEEHLDSDIPTIPCKYVRWMLGSSTSTNRAGDFTITTDTYSLINPSTHASINNFPSSSSCFAVLHGSVSEVLKSTFHSHLAVVHSVDDVNLFREIVLSDKKTARATHNIFAYRFTSDSGIVHHDTDDDGETAAGAKLGEMLRLMGVDNYAVIVSRVYGGVNLGPNRFKCICNSARKLIEEHIASQR